MSLITPGFFQYILSLSILSRLIVLAIQFISNIIIVDHEPDAYINKYYSTLANDTTLDSENYSSPSVTYRLFYTSIQGLTKWDAQYFLEISNDGYVSERHLAFFPMFPILISLTRQLVFERTEMSVAHMWLANSPTKELKSLEEQRLPIADLENYVRSAVVGCALNNFVFFPIACVSLFALTRLVKGKDEKYARNVIWWFCFNPASVFFSACYSESSFAAMTFTAMFLIECRAQNYLSRFKSTDVQLKSKKAEFKPLEHLNRLLYIALPCLAPIALSIATRSNGLVTIGFLGYQLLLKYAPATKLKRDDLSIIVRISLFLEFIQDLLVLLMSTVIAASGFITFQIYSYIKFCLQDSKKGLEGQILHRPEWCDYSVPFSYGKVQAKYWDVGLFRYYQAKKLPNFLLALPISYLVLIGALRESKQIPKKLNGKKQIVYYIHGVLLTIFCGLSINVEVTTRLLASSCPVVYWICADLAELSRPKSRVLVAYCISYLVVGTILHTNYYPWT